MDFLLARWPTVGSSVTLSARGTLGVAKAGPCSLEGSTAILFDTSTYLTYELLACTFLLSEAVAIGPSNNGSPQRIFSAAIESLVGLLRTAPPWSLRCPSFN